MGSLARETSLDTWTPLITTPNHQSYVSLHSTQSMAAAQALDFREFQPGKGTACARGVIRKHVEHLHVDRPLYNDHNRMKALVKSGEILEEVEKEVGELE